MVSVAAHAAAVAITVDWLVRPEARDADNPPAVMLELSPLPVLLEAAAAEAPPGPDLSEVVPEPEAPPPAVEFPPMPVATLPAAETPMPARRPSEPVERKPDPRPPTQRTATPQAKQAADAATAPAADPTPRPDSAAMPTWKGQLLRHLERHKRYPLDAQRARQEGIAYVRFTMARDGRVLMASIERGTSIVSLDREGLDLLRRAEPLPPLPLDQPGETLALIVPIQFTLRR